MKAIWTGAIGFGLVNIPVKLYSAVQQSELDLDMLDKKDHANIKFKRVNAETGKEVAWENIIRGYKLDDKYVILEPEDFEKASPEKTKMIEINSFVDEKEIDAMYFEAPYYLQPEKAGVRAYALLRDALTKTGKAGLGTYVLRSRESLVIIKPLGDILVLNKIRFEQEIRDAEEIKVTSAKSKPAELKMAVQLINQLTTPFDISKYKDTYSEKLMKLIKAKAKGRKVQAPVLRVAHSRSRDLMAQLKESLGTPAKKKAS
ncbi:MAG: Ku protein [Agriterribacter sp.]